MNPTPNPCRERMAEAYATGNHSTSFPDTVEQRAYLTGWQDCIKHDEVVRELVEALRMRERKGCNDTCANALNETLVCDCGFYAVKNALAAYREKVK